MSWSERTAVPGVPSTRADLVALLERVGVGLPCQRPVFKKFRDEAGQVGEVALRCGTRFRRRCPSCADLYRGDVRAVLYAGLEVLEDLGHALFFVTFTAPSFGSVHRAAKSHEQMVRVCRCGRRHEAGSVLRGVPLSLDEYDYVGQVQWNYCSGRLLSRTMDKIARLAGERVQYFTTAEYQSRGAIHFHSLMRVPRHLVPVFADVVRSAAGAARVYSGAGRSGDQVGWGPQVDVRRVRAGKGGREAHLTGGYLAKLVGYQAKDLGRDVLDEGVHDEAIEGGDRRLRAVHVRKMREAVPEAMDRLAAVGGLPRRPGVADTVEEWQARPVDVETAARDGGTAQRVAARYVRVQRKVPVQGAFAWDYEVNDDPPDTVVESDEGAAQREVPDRVVSQWGWRGHVIRKSRRWGLTMTQCRERRTAHNREQEGLGEDGPGLEWLPGVRTELRTEWTDLIAAYRTLARGTPVASG